MRDINTTSFSFRPLDQLVASEDNPRVDLGDLSELAASVEELGVLQALLVVPDPDIPAGCVRVIDGHRRLAAARLAGVDKVPVTMSISFADEGKRVAAMIATAAHRRDLSPMEEARALQHLVDLGKSQREVARLVGRTQAHVSRRLALTRLPDDAVRMLDTGRITIEQAVQMSQLDADALQRVLHGPIPFDTALGIETRKREREREAKPAPAAAAPAPSNDKIAEEVPPSGKSAAPLGSQSKRPSAATDTHQGEGVEGGDSEGDAGDGVEVATDLIDIEEAGDGADGQDVGRVLSEPEPARQEVGERRLPSSDTDVREDPLAGMPWWRQVELLETIVGQLYHWIVGELDPEPRPIQGYLVPASTDMLAVAAQALFNTGVEDLPAEDDEDQEPPPWSDDWWPRYDRADLSYFRTVVPSMRDVDELDRMHASLLEHGHPQLDEVLALVDDRLIELGGAR